MSASKDPYGIIGSMERYGYVYKTTIVDPEDGFDGCYYIGQHKGAEKDKRYWGSGRKLQAYIQRRGVERLRVEILCWCYSKEELEKKEREEIKKVWFADPRCLNASVNTYWAIMDEETRKRMGEKTRERMMGNTYTLGYKHTPEALKKISEASKRFWKDPTYLEKHKDWCKGKNNPMYGKKHTAETREKMRQKQRELGAERRIKGYRWWTNGENNKLSPDCPGEGYKLGRTYKRGKNGFDYNKSQAEAGN